MLDIPGYTIRRELGRGAMGIVYRALDERRGVEVALKTLRFDDAPTIHRFKREFRALSGLSHPNLVSLHQLVNDRGIWFFTMELVEGVSFLEHVRHGGPPGQMEGRLRPAL